MHVADVQIHQHPRLSTVVGTQRQLVEIELDHIHLFATHLPSWTVRNERQRGSPNTQSRLVLILY